MSDQKTDVPYGTLDLLILKTLDTMGPMHGYRIARRIEQVAENLLRLNQGSIYPPLMRLEQQGWIRTQWGISETKRKVKFYSLTLDVQVGTEIVRLGPGGSAYAPRLIPHTWQPAGGKDVRFLSLAQPAGDLEGFLNDLSRLQERGTR